MNLCHHSLSFSKVNIIFNPYYDSFRVSKNIPATKTIVCYLSAISTSQKSRSFNNELMQWKNVLLHIYPIAYFLLFWNERLIYYTRIAIHWISKPTSRKFWSGNFGVDLNLRNMTGRINVLTTSLYVEFFSLVISWIIYIFVPSFQCKKSSYFCEPDRFWFSSDSTYGQQIWD